MENKTMRLSKKISICVANLNAYYNGNVTGEWITLPMDKEHLQIELNKVTKKGSLGNYAIHDYENDMNIKINEFDNIYELNELAWKLCKLDCPVYVISSLFELLDRSDIERILDDELEFYYYEDIESYSQLADVLIEDGYFGWDYNTLKNMGFDASYVDLESIGRDLDAGGEWLLSSCNVAIQCRL